MAKEKEERILSTTDYDQFIKLDGNREYNKGLLTVLSESIQNDGDFLKYNPILVNEKMEIIDGQHRLKVAKSLGVTVYYIVGEGLRLTHAQVFNSRKRQWTSTDFLHSFVSMGDRDAQALSDFMGAYRLSVAISVKLLSKSISAGSMKRFREGKFEVVDAAWAENAAGLLSTIREYSPDYAFAHNACIKAVTIMLDKLADPKVFERKLTQYNNTITRRPAAKDYLRQFELILNAGSDSKQISLL